MKKLYRIVFVLVFIASSFAAFAQNDGITFSLLPHSPYKNFLNPGIRVPYKGMVGIGISNVSFNMYNSSIKAGDIYGTNAYGEDVIDALSIMNSLDDHDNFISSKISMDVLNVGFRVNKLFFNIDWRLRADVELNYDKDFIGLFVLGNYAYLGDNACDFALGVDATAYSEIGIGVQYDINEKLTVGIRPKLLGGVLNIDAGNEKTRIFTDPNTYAISGDVNIDIKAASVMNSDISRISDVFKMFDTDSIAVQDMFNFTENIGFGIDFGASYTFNEHVGVAAGVYDLGFIKWKDAKTKQKSEENVSLNDALFETFSDLAGMNLNYSSLLDDVVDAVWGNDSLQKGGEYTTYLKTRIMAQGYYEFNPMVRLTGIAQMYYIKNQLRPALTLAYSGEFWNMLDLTASFTMSKYSGTALGLGLGFHAGPFNFYAVTDNVLVLTKISKPIVEAATSYTATNFRLGIVWTIGKYQYADSQE